MRQLARTWTVAAAAMFALVGVPAGIVTIQPGAHANADVCANVGRRISVGGCMNLADVMAPYAPPPGYYAPLPPPPPPPPPPPSYGP